MNWNAYWFFQFWMEDKFKRIFVFMQIIFVLNISDKRCYRERYMYICIKIEELISITSYIHSYMLLICSSGHSKEANFHHKIYFKSKCWY